MKIHDYPQNYSRTDQHLIAFLMVGCPRLNFKKKGGREDGFVNRMHKAMYIYRNLSIRRKYYQSGNEYFEVESVSKELVFSHRVHIDIEDGQHLCTCPDGTYHHVCSHILAVLFRVASELVEEWNNDEVSDIDEAEAGWADEEPAMSWQQEAGAMYGDYSDGTKSILDLEALGYGDGSDTPIEQYARGL